MTDTPSNIVPLHGRTLKTLTPAALRSSTAWLAVWTPAEPLPDGVSAQLPAMIESAERASAPADIKAFAVAMDELTQWVERFGVIPLDSDKVRRQAQISDVVQGYHAALSDLPSDLLISAIKETIAAHKFRTLPLPGDIRARAEGELRERSDRLRRLRTAKMRADMDAKTRAAEPSDAPRERTPEELAAVAAAKEQAMQALSEGPVKAIPAERDDLKPQRDDSTAAARRRVAEGLTGYRKIDRTAQPWGAAQ